VWKKGGSTQTPRKAGRGAGLRKKLDSKSTQWKKRWLQLDGDELMYAKDPKDLEKGGKPREGFDLRQFGVRPDLGQKEGFSSKEHGFSLIGDEREVLFAALSGRDKQAWVSSLQATRHRLLGTAGAEPEPEPEPEVQPAKRVREKFGWLYRKETSGDGDADHPSPQTQTRLDEQASSERGGGRLGLKAKALKHARPHGRSKWKKRWVVVRGSRLVCYKDAESAFAIGVAAKEKGAVELSDATIQDNLGAKEGSSSQAYGFCVTPASGADFLLAAADDREKQEWVEYLEGVSAAGSGADGMLDSAETPCAQGFLYKKGGFKGKDEEEEEEAVSAAAAEEVRHLFEAYDEDGDGTLSPAEIKKLSRELGKELSKSELEEAVREIDADGDGEVHILPIRHRLHYLRYCLTV